MDNKTYLGIFPSVLTWSSFVQIPSPSTTHPARCQKTGSIELTVYWTTKPKSAVDICIEMLAGECICFLGNFVYMVETMMLCTEEIKIKQEGDRWCWRKTWLGGIGGCGWSGDYASSRSVCSLWVVSMGGWSESRLWYSHWCQFGRRLRVSAGYTPHSDFLQFVNEKFEHT